MGNPLTLFIGLAYAGIGVAFYLAHYSHPDVAAGSWVLSAGLYVAHFSTIALACETRPVSPRSRSGRAWRLSIWSGGGPQIFIPCRWGPKRSPTQPSCSLHWSSGQSSRACQPFCWRRDHRGILARLPWTRHRRPVVGYTTVKQHAFTNWLRPGGMMCPPARAGEPLALVLSAKVLSSSACGRTATPVSVRPARKRSAPM